MLLEMFFIFFKIGAFTFGGGYAMLPIIQKEIVGKGWIKEEEFIDAIAVAQSSPGVIAVNISLYTGYKVAGVPGAIVAVLGSILPSFLIILLLASCLYQYRDNPILDRIFMGIAPAVPALIMAAVYRIIRTSGFGVGALVVSFITFLLIAFLRISPIYMIIIGAVASVFLNKLVENKNK